MLKVIIKNTQNEITNAATFETEELCLNWISENSKHFPENFTYVIMSGNKTAEELRQQESEEALSLGNKLMAKIRAINRRKLRVGLWSESQFNALLTSSVAANIERALWNGSLETAAYLMTNLSSFYSDIEIGEIIAEINAHETKWNDLI